MNRERRKTYRVALRPCERLLVSIHPEGRLPLLGDVVDLSIYGASASCSVKPPPLQLGERVRIRLSTRGGPRPIELDALVASRSDEQRVRRYGLQFLERSALEEGLSRRMFQLFNRRGQVRIRMNGTPAAVRSEGPGEPTTHAAVLHDLSVRGLGLQVPVEAEADLRGVRRLTVRFRLEEGGRPLQVVAAIRNRRTTPQGMIYGLEIDPVATRHHDDVQDLLMQFLRRRERELLVGPETPAAGDELQVTA